MSQIDPTRTTAHDICNAALKDCGAYGVGQTPLAEDIYDAKARLQWMLQQWERKRWFIYHLVTYSCVAQPDPSGQFQGKQAYSVGPGGDFDTNVSPFTGEFTGNFGGSIATSARPNRIESAFLRQITMSQPNQIDYPLTQLFSREDYNKIALKGLSSFPAYFFYDTSWGMGMLYPWPIPQAHIYEVHISVREQLPPMFTEATASHILDIPWEYYNAMVLQLAIRLRPKYGILAMQGDTLQAQAKDALNTLKKSNFQIARLAIPGDLGRPQLYNIFSDRMY